MEARHVRAPSTRFAFLKSSPWTQQLGDCAYCATEPRGHPSGGLPARPWGCGCGRTFNTSPCTACVSCVGSSRGKEQLPKTGPVRPPTVPHSLLVPPRGSLLELHRALWFCRPPGRDAHRTPGSGSAASSEPDASCPSNGLPSGGLSVVRPWGESKSYAYFGLCECACRWVGAHMGTLVIGLGTHRDPGRPHVRVPGCIYETPVSTAGHIPT